MKRKTKLLYLLGLLVIGFFGVVTFFGDEGLLKLRKLYSLRNQVQVENQELFLTNQKLAHEIIHLKETAHTERLIREKLGYIKSGEYILILDNKNESQPGRTPGSPSGL